MQDFFHGRALLNARSNRVISPVSINYPLNTKNNLHIKNKTHIKNRITDLLDANTRKFRVFTITIIIALIMITESLKKINSQKFNLQSIWKESPVVLVFLGIGLVGLLSAIIGQLATLSERISIVKKASEMSLIDYVLKKPDSSFHKYLCNNHRNLKHNLFAFAIASYSTYVIGLILIGCSFENFNFFDSSLPNSLSDYFSKDNNMYYLFITGMFFISLAITFGIIYIGIKFCQYKNNQLLKQHAEYLDNPLLERQEQPSSYDSLVNEVLSPSYYIRLDQAVDRELPLKRHAKCSDNHLLERQEQKPQSYDSLVNEVPPPSYYIRSSRLDQVDRELPPSYSIYDNFYTR